ncbi:demethoxyubiquinone hydroxylase family protein [Ectopseudomonas hydrolytica]|uniref:demethoxyubiquinone hydroxylase family protein n=1 Tax=Ectopseudomonas hydrolytica TaxID=2493633 RepID=UPI003C30A680
MKHGDIKNNRASIQVQLNNTKVCGKAMSAQQEIERILRVAHAGERGAISIYTAQIAISKHLWPSCVPALEEMLTHEKSHYLSFDAALKKRNARACYALPLWHLGGAVLGLITGLLGPKAIWACTAAVENTVYKHLQEQITFLERHDKDALLAVKAIEADEKSHLDHALNHGGRPVKTNKIIWTIVSSCTTVAIWLSRRL